MAVDLSYPTLRESNIAALGNPERGKVRDVYDMGGGLLCIVATDRISTHDVVYGQCIPNKGFALTQTAIEAFGFLENGGIPSHLVASPDPNVMIVKRAEVYPVEAVVRGIITGSAWKAYTETGQICGIKLPKGLRKNQMLDEPLFTPTTKAKTGHDKALTFDELVKLIGDVAYEIRRFSVRAYRIGAEKAAKHGGLLADTKFEWGEIPDIGLGLVDEALTHDSSRYVGVEDLGQALEEGRDPNWFDKQVVRDYAERVGFKGEGPAPHLPDEIILADISAVGMAYRLLTGRELEVPDEPPSDSRITINLEKDGWFEV